MLLSLTEIFSIYNFPEFTSAGSYLTPTEEESNRNTVNSFKSPVLLTAVEDKLFNYKTFKGFMKT